MIEFILKCKNIYIYKNKIILISVFLYIFLKNNSWIIQLEKKDKKNYLISQDNMIKLGSYNIYIDKIKDFYESKYFIFINGKNCPNPEKQTIFFKPIYPNVPYKFIKFQEKNLSLKAIEDKDIQITAYTQNINETREIFLKKIGFKLENKISWHNLYMTPYIINNSLKNQITKFIVNDYQKINKFFNFQEYVSKSSLYINYKKFEDKYPSDYNYMLESYSYPDERDIIEKKFYNYSFNNNKDIWMIKPKFGSVGAQISILTNFSKIKLKNYVITKYLYNPYLIKGYKFDLRFHGLISGIKPLRLYLYNEGFVRIASEKYNFSSLNISNKFSFLTNIFVNAKNKKKYIYPQNISNIEDSNLWNLETFQKYCKKNNINYNKIYLEIENIFIKAIMTVRKKLIKYIDENKLKYSNFYHLIGFDMILDENLKPYLLEMNRKCSFRNDNDAEKYYTYNIFTDTFNILGIRPEKLHNNSINNNKMNTLKKNLEEVLCELDRPRGGYKLIFPLKKNIEKYKKFFGKIIPEEDQELWKQLLE